MTCLLKCNIIIIFLFTIHYLRCQTLKTRATIAAYRTRLWKFISKFLETFPSISSLTHYHCLNIVKYMKIIRARKLSGIWDRKYFLRHRVIRSSCYYVLYFIHTHNFITLLNFFIFVSFLWIFQGFTFESWAKFSFNRL